MQVSAITPARKQLGLFKSGERSDDNYGRMRGIAGKLTDAEITDVANFYAATR